MTDDPPQSARPVLEVTGLDKRYGGVHALDDVTWSVRPGEVHGLVGENGAGKSTLIKMISGAQVPDAGTVKVDGHEIPLGNTQAALAAGVSAVYQEPQLFADLTVAENIFLGREDTVGGRVRWREQQVKARELLDRLHLDPAIMHMRVADLPVGEQQLVSIAKAFAADVRLLILDEPSAILADADIERLFTIVKGLRDQGIGVIYISHRLDELGQITDRITVMRDGAVVGTHRTEDMTPTKIARAMVGDKFQVADRSGRDSQVRDEVVLAARGLAAGRHLAGADLELRKGEILGVYGLIGSGTTELVRALYGITPAAKGTIEINGHKVRIDTPARAAAHGIAMLPGNRKTQGVFLPKSLSFNISSSHLGFFSRLGLFDHAEERRHTSSVIDRLRIKAPGPDTVIADLSGGNQQKVVMARQLVEDPRILLVEEPTQGVDVGAKAEIHQLILDHVAQGNSALVLSTDLEEIRFLADRIVVMRRGRTEAVLPGDVSAVELLGVANGDSPVDGDEAACGDGKKDAE
ncbi:sugar ABC transporter ATP-binding protein [Schaalia sp. 19OD2882]|uniref:sugar ABC transporter ATP-binding protein n=1 Tax=Schaalia sp. 19OD2882 TaxID=2794089 RepID=UPI001C1F04CD|nr:sugar ABC transporter ATP-binding protein [Schaalia sp. 19OD2882]QWW19463.1 sugar ABC transporter ATP-binding protein [Schaalia sp. 19OD2882]